jgi:hypothetical protein
MIIVVFLWQIFSTLQQKKGGGGGGYNILFYFILGVGAGGRG